MESKDKISQTDFELHPLSFLNDGGLGVLEHSLILNWVFHPLFEFQGLGIGLEIHGTARVLPPLQYPGDRFCTPLIKIFRHGPAFLPGVIGGNGQHLVGCEDFCDLHGTFPGNAEIKDALYHLCPVSYTHLDVYKRQVLCTLI